MIQVNESKQREEKLINNLSINLNLADQLRSLFNSNNLDEILYKLKESLSISKSTKIKSEVKFI